MGVRSLQSYLEQSCPSAIPIQNIKDLADERRESPDQELVIVVDAITFIGQSYGDLEWIGGAQLNQFAEIAEEFVQAFRNIGIRLVFFLDGPKVQKKRNTWVERRMATMTKIYHILDEISYGNTSQSIPKKEYFILPGGMSQHSRLIFETLCGCEVHQSILECDEEIAEYARSQNALGILGHDSDYVILNIGHALYLDMHHLDITTMTTRVYYPKELARTLGLQLSQLPLLATLMGTDFIQFDELRNFHYRFAQTRNPNILVPKLAGLVKSLQTSTLDQDMLVQLAKHVLGDSSRVDEIKASIDSYQTAPLATATHHPCSPPKEETEETWLWLLEESRQRHQNNHQPSMIYNIMIGDPLESGNFFEDYRLTDLPTFAKLTREIRQRVYGILLEEKPQKPRSHKVEEWCMAGPGSLDGPSYNEVVPPDTHHPGLVALWADDDSLDDVRWTLFVRSVSSQLDVQSVRSLPPHLVIPTLIVYTIVHFEGTNQWLEPWEAEVMLASAAVLQHYSTQQLAELPADPMSTRAIRIASLIMRSTFVFYNLQAACGSPISAIETAPWKFFDGKLFQMKYREAKDKASNTSLCDNKTDSLKDFNEARRVVFGN